MKNIKPILVTIILAAMAALIILLLVMKQDKRDYLTDEQKQYLKSISPIKLAVDPDWYPFERLNAKGEYTGIGADYIRLVENRLGVRFEIVPTQDWNQSLEYSKEGKVTLLSLLNKSEERNKWLIFSEPLIVDDNVIIGRYDSPYINDLSMEDNKTVVLPEGTSVEERLRKAYPKLIIELTESEEEAFERVSKGQADFTIRSLLVAEYNIRKQGWFDLKVIGKVEGYTNYLSMGIASDKEPLKPILDKAILSITEQERVDVLNKHVPFRVEIKDNNKMIIAILIVTIIGAAILLIAGFFQSRRARYLEKHNLEIREITERYEALSELSGTYFWQMDTQGIYTYVSPEVAKVLGFEVKELLGRNHAEYIQTEDEQGYRLRIAEAQTLKNYEIRHLKKDGSLLWIKVDAMSVFDRQGQVAAYSGSSTDIERRKQLENTLIDAKNAMELACYQAQIGPHFLYNAMSAIALYCLTEPKKASSLITDLSFFLRKSYDFKNMDYLVTLGQELELIEAYVNIEKVRFENRLQVDYRIPEELCHQLLPPLILQPLIENAINHGLMKRIEGGRLVISAVRKEAGVVFEVRDNGVGIGEEQVRRLLEEEPVTDPADAERETALRSQGIGLKNIHSRLMKMYHKGISITRNEDGGTTVAFILPESGKAENKR